MTTELEDNYIKAVLTRHMMGEDEVYEAYSNNYVRRHDENILTFIASCAQDELQVSNAPSDLLFPELYGEDYAKAITPCPTV